MAGSDFAVAEQTEGFIRLNTAAEVAAVEQMYVSVGGSTYTGYVENYSPSTVHAVRASHPSQMKVHYWKQAHWKCTSFYQQSRLSFLKEKWLIERRFHQFYFNGVIEAPACMFARTKEIRRGTTFQEFKETSLHKEASSKVAKKVTLGGHVQVCAIFFKRWSFVSEQAWS